MKTEKIKPEQTEKRKKENAVAKSKKDRNAKIPTPCPECHKVFQSYNSMTSHKTRAHSKNTATYKNAHKEKSLLTIRSIFYMTAKFLFFCHYPCFHSLFNYSTISSGFCSRFF